MNKKKIILIVVVVFIIIGLIYYNRSNPKIQAIKDKITPPKAPIEPVVNSGFNVVVPDLSNDSFPLKQGSKGERVKTLQLAINKINEQQGSKNDPLLPDGIFGAKTEDLILKVAGVAYLSGAGMSEMQFNNLIILSTKPKPDYTPGETF